MTPRLARLCLVAGLILLWSLGLGAEDWSKVFKQVVHDHLVVIEIELEGQKERGNCSGVVVAPHQVLTAKHCLLEAELPKQTGYVRGKQVHILKAGPADLALIDADTKGKKSIFIPFVGPDPGTPVAGIGHAFGDNAPSISPMSVISTERGLLFSNNTFFKGWSGGPLVTLQGHLAGIMVATNTEWGFALSVDISTIRAFLVEETATPTGIPTLPAQGTWE